MQYYTKKCIDNVVRYASGYDIGQEILFNPLEKVVMAAKRSCNQGTINKVQQPTVIK